MKQWIARTDRERRGTAGDSASRVRLWIAHLFLRSAEAISAEAIEDLIVSRREEVSAADLGSPIEPAGPPAHWVARVREGAPELLLPPEQGGTSPNGFHLLPPFGLGLQTMGAPASRSVPASGPKPARRKDETVSIPEPQAKPATHAPLGPPASTRHSHERETDTDVQPRSFAERGAQRSHDQEIPASTKALHNASKSREDHAFPVTTLADNERSGSTPSALSKRERSDSSQLPVDDRVASDLIVDSQVLLGNQTAPPAAREAQRRPPQQRWWSVRKTGGDPDASQSGAVPVRRFLSMKLPSPEAHREISRAGGVEAASPPPVATLQVAQRPRPVPPLRPRAVPLRPNPISAWGSSEPAKTRTSTEANSVNVSQPDDDFDRWPELPEELPLDTDISFRAFADSEHWRALNAEQKGGR